MEVESWKLTDFNLSGRQIKIGKLGLVKIMKADDGNLTLVGDANYGIIDHDRPSPASFVKTDSILGFALDIGIQKEKMLSRRHGFYFGTKLIHPQSQRILSQSDFNAELFEKIGSVIDGHYQSGDKHRETKAIKLQLLFDTYNNARLLFPNYYAESYLSLMSIIDAIGSVKSGCKFAFFVSTISPTLNDDVFERINAVDGYKERVDTALELFDTCLDNSNNNKMDCHSDMASLDSSGKLIFSCFYSAYQYRNQFVHAGFPFPDIVKDVHGLEKDSGMAYLNPALGISWHKINRSDGLQEGDLIDIHEVASREVENFKKKYFILLPTWYFLKRFAREALLKEINAQ